MSKNLREREAYTERAKQRQKAIRSSAMPSTASSVVNSMPGTVSSTPPLSPQTAQHGFGPVSANAVTPSTTTTTTTTGPDSRGDARIERLLAVLETHDPSPRGAAIVSLARFMVSRRRSSDIVSATELAADLLSADTEQTLRVITTLLSDGWSGNLGELLSCARTL